MLFESSFWQPNSFYNLKTSITLTQKILSSAVCDFELSGPEGFVESAQIAGEGRALQTEAVDCRWYIKAPPRATVCIC